jgi:RiboL-PSP-HEPN
MRNSLLTFEQNIAETHHLSLLYRYMTDHIRAPYAYEDLLRSQLVYAVSAFDKLIHDLVRIGMLQIFMGQRLATPAYLARTITIQTHGDLTGATFPPKEFLFQQEIVQQLSRSTFQDPDRIVEGLAHIWSATDKWAMVAKKFGSMSSADVRTRLKLIANRRNAIVHEADMDPLTNAKTPITAQECEQSVAFLLACGQAITNLVV